MRARLMITLALCAPASTIAASPSLVASAEPIGGDGVRRFGLELDAGVPDGATAALVLRPWRPLRLDAGVSYNGVSHGVRGGVTLVPFASWLSPTLSVDYGHYFDGDANPLARQVSADPTFSSAVLDRVGYDYADAHVGLEFGRTYFTFYIHAGASRLTTTVHELSAAVADPMSPTTITFTRDPTVTVIAATARVGFILYFGK